MREIPLANGRGVALVDDEDYAAAAQYKWHVLPVGYRQYACRKTRTEAGVRKTVLMHREIMRPAGDMDVDHVDGNGLNNTRANLRTCTRGENMRNKCKARYLKSGEASSRFKGVYDRKIDPWAACIQVEGRAHHLGTFATEEDAARAYDAAAREYFGEFARLNFPDEHEQAA